MEWEDVGAGGKAVGGEAVFAVRSLEELQKILEGVTGSVTWRLRERPDSRIEIAVRDVAPGYIAVTQYVPEVRP